MQGRSSWTTSCICVCVWTRVCLWASVTLCDCVCVCLRLGPRLLPEVEFHSLLFHYSYKATAPLHRVQSCKNFFPCFPHCLVHPSSSFSFMVTVGMGLNICANWFFSPFWDLRQKQSWTYPISNTFYINQYFFKLKQLLNCWSKTVKFFSSSNYFIAKIFSSSTDMFYLMVLHSYIRCIRSERFFFVSLPGGIKTEEVVVNF